MQNLLIDLRLKLGPEYDIQLADNNLIEINAPMENEIGDNYQLFIQQLDDDTYRIDDGGNSLNEFEMYLLKRDLINQYLKINNVIVIETDLIIIKSSLNLLIDNIYKMLRIVAGITAIQQIQSRNQGRK